MSSIPAISTAPVSLIPFSSLFPGAFPSTVTSFTSFPSSTPILSAPFPESVGVTPTGTAVSTPFYSGPASVGNFGSFRTPNESTELLWREQTVNAAAYLAAIAWGLYLAIFYKAVVNIFKSKNRTHLRWLPFVGSLFAFATVSMCCFANFNEQAWIDQRGYPRGPLFFLTDQQHIPVYVTAVVASLITQFLGQAFLAYRCHALFNKWWITAPVIIWTCCSLGLSSAWAVALRASNTIYILGQADPISQHAPAIELAMAFNIVISAALLGRLLYLAPKVPTVFPVYIRKRFVRVDAIIVESTIFLGIISLVYVCLFGQGSTGANLFFPFIVQLEAIFPTLIVIRIVQGWGWDAGLIYRTPTDYHHPYAHGVAHDAASVTSSEVIREKVGMHPAAANAA